MDRPTVGIDFRAIAGEAKMIERIGNCRIVDEIGSGGMATVYKAVQEPLDRTVAVKMLKMNIAQDVQFAQRFEREALFMASLQHENILHVIDFVKDHKTLSIVMEYIDGIDLYDLLERAPRLPVEVAAIIALQVARALDYAHFRGIVHRDIKPANIILSFHGEVKLMDFGIARDETLTDLTEAGTGLGTPSYMSPEQILGDKLDFRSDLFSLGIVLYQMITGRKPFVEDDAHTVMQKIRLDKFTSARRINAAVPRSLERILSRCMEKMPANRYLTTQGLIDDLMEFLASRISMNYNARIVLYLRDTGVLDDEAADKILAAGAPRSLRRGSLDRRTVRQVSLVQGALLLAGIAGATAIQLSDATVQDPFTKTSPGVAVDYKALGFVRVAAQPWAHVFVDGMRAATTPFARPLPLSPGTHYVRLENPYSEPVTQEVHVRPGHTSHIAVTLKPKGASSRAKQREKRTGSP